MANLKLQVNQSVELHVKSGVYNGEYLSQITRIDNQEIQVTLPIKKETLIPLPVGTKLEVIYTDQVAKYKFDTQVLSRQMEGNIGTCKLQYPSKVEKIQRRDFVRVPIRETVYYRRLIVDSINGQINDLINLGYDEAEQNDFQEAVTEDISGGGVLLVVDKYIPLDVFIELKFDVKELSFQKVLGKVVRIDELPNRSDRLGLGIEFINFNRSKQDEIVQWVLQKQLELHRKGLL